MSFSEISTCIATHYVFVVTLYLSSLVLATDTRSLEAQGELDIAIRELSPHDRNISTGNSDIFTTANTTELSEVIILKYGNFHHIFAMARLPWVQTCFWFG